MSYDRLADVEGHLQKFVALRRNYGFGSLEKRLFHFTFLMLQQIELFYQSANQGASRIRVRVVGVHFASVHRNAVVHLKEHVLVKKALFLRIDENLLNQEK